MWKSSSLQDSITGFRSWTHQTLIINLQWRPLSMVTTNASAHSRLEGEQRLTENLKYLFPLDRQLVSLSSLHPLNALFFIGLPFPIVSASSGIAQSTFAGHLIAHPERVCATDQKDWNETLVRETLLKNLTALENRLAGEGFDFYNDAEYQDSLIVHLRTQGLVPPQDREYVFVEPWRTRARGKILELRKIRKGIESRGEEEAKGWLDGVETEEEWAGLMDRLLEWGEEHGIQ